MNLPVVDFLTHAAVAHVGPPPIDQVGLCQNAIHGIPGGCAGKQIDFKTFSILGTADQCLGNQLRIAGGKAGDKYIGPILDVATCLIRIGDLIQKPF